MMLESTTLHKTHTDRMPSRCTSITVLLAARAVKRPGVKTQIKMRLHARTQSGLSLIELMIAMLLGIVLTAGMATVFSGSKRSATLNTTFTELQESARFSMDSMVRDVRLAGFQGCTPTTESGATAVILASNAPTDDLHGTALSTHTVNNDGTWSPSIAFTGFTPPASGEIGAPVEGTHALSVQFGSPETYRIESMASRTAPIVLADSVTPADIGLMANDVAMISDCQKANIFTVSSTGTNSIQHASSVNRNSQGLADGRLSAAFINQSDDRARTRLMRFEANIYYIGDTQRTSSDGNDVLALFRMSLPYVLPTTGATVPPVEMIEGVTDLRLRVGMHSEDISNDDVIFVAPEDVPSTAGIIGSVEIGMLVESFANISDNADQHSYTLAGYTLTPSTARGDTTYRTDRRMRLAFNSTVDVRNR